MPKHGEGLIKLPFKGHCSRCPNLFLPQIAKVLHYTHQLVGMHGGAYTHRDECAIMYSTLLLACKGFWLPCLFNLYAEQHFMRIAGLDALQAGIKIGQRNINNLRYADNTTLMAESKEELNSLLMRVKEDSASLKSTFRKQRSWHPFPSTHSK